MATSYLQFFDFLEAEEFESRVFAGGFFISQVLYLTSLLVNCLPISFCYPFRGIY